MPIASVDAVVVGSGPNGLAAAVRIAQAGRRVHVIEAADEIGGGCRTDELTEPGFRHDVCAAVHPLGAASPYLSTLGLERFGLRWLHHDLPFAHPLDGGRGAAAHHSIDETAEALGPDGKYWRWLFSPMAAHWDDLASTILGPPLRVPRHPIALARFGLPGMLSVMALTKRFASEEARGLLAGVSAHSFAPLTMPFTAAIGMILAAPAHVSGWPIAEGGSAAITNALAGLLKSLGGTIETGHPVRSWTDLPAHGVALFDTSTEALVKIAGDRLPARTRRQYLSVRRGPIAYKVDYALSGPMPWTHQDSRRASTLHLGGTAAEIAAAEAECNAGRMPDRPYVLAAQPTLADPTRAPAGKHVFYAYGHMPAGADERAVDRIEAQFDRFAPGWRDLVIARSVMGPQRMEAHNANLIGGDITAGTPIGTQVVFRPAMRVNPYATGNDSIWLCSAAAPPGAGVHGMCGYWAAVSALKAKG